MAIYYTKSFKKLITRYNQEEWLARAQKACKGNTALFQKVIRLIWWDIIQYQPADLLRAQIDDRYSDVDIPDKTLTATLKRIGYPERLALQRSHFVPQRKGLPKGRPRKQPEDE